MNWRISPGFETAREGQPINSLDMLLGQLLGVSATPSGSMIQKTMHHGLTNKIVVLSLFGFILAVLAIAYHHHHDGSFLLRSCTICKVKTSISGTFNKYKIDSTPVAAIGHLLPVASPLHSTGTIQNRNFFTIDSRIAFPYPNKAPPFRY
jgi:hypothetical protein